MLQLKQSLEMVSRDGLSAPHTAGTVSCKPESRKRSTAGVQRDVATEPMADGQLIFFSLMLTVSDAALSACMPMSWRMIKHSAAGLDRE